MNREDLDEELGYPLDIMEEILTDSIKRFEENAHKGGDEKKLWLRDEARWHIWKACDELFQARDEAELARKDEMLGRIGDAFNHMLFAVDIVDKNPPETDDIELPDSGVAPVEGLLCQNFEEHPEREIRMQSGPYVGVMCPECGRTAGGPDTEIPYTDEPVGDND